MIGISHPCARVQCVLLWRLYENDRTRDELVSMLAIAALMAVAPAGAPAQDLHSHAGPGQELLQDQKSKGGALVRTVREATERFKDVTVAEAEGYHLQFGCVSGPDSGAMGMHFVNVPLVGDGVIDATKPEIVIYEPQPNGRLRIIGADLPRVRGPVERDALDGAAS